MKKRAHEKEIRRKTIMLPLFRDAEEGRRALWLVIPKMCNSADGTKKTGEEKRSHRTRMYSPVGADTSSTLDHINS
jgi:hypothetical protein